MNDRPPRRRFVLLWLVGLGACLALGGSGFYFLQRADAVPVPPVEMPPPSAEASHAEVRQLCTVCHAYPSPDIFPRSGGRKEIRQAYDFFRNSSLALDYPPLESVAAYYENRAPEALPVPVRDNSPDGPPIQFRKTSVPLPSVMGPPNVSNVNLVHLSDNK